MTRTLTARFGAALLLPALIAARPLDPKPHVIDKAHSEINFVADSRMLSAHGFFGKWDANVALDAANLAASSVSITIDAASINTRVERRDDHLRSPDFFDVAKYPTITFKSVKIMPAAGNKLTIEGDLTVKDVTKRISVPASMMFYDKGVGRFRGQFTILRKDFGINYDGAVNPIENEVQVQWDIAVKEPAPAK